MCHLVTQNLLLVLLMGIPVVDLDEFVVLSGLEPEITGLVADDSLFLVQLVVEG